MTVGTFFRCVWALMRGQSVVANVVADGRDKVIRITPKGVVVGNRFRHMGVDANGWW